MPDFIKMQGLRNHFVIVDARAAPYRPPPAEIIWVCDPQVGVGADELVVLEPSNLPDVVAFMRIYNIDGTEVQACGNATRCVAWLLLEEARVDDVLLETHVGPLRAYRRGDHLVQVEMGELTQDWQAMPLSGPQDVMALPVGNGVLQAPVGLAIGNPHAVFFADNLEAIDLPDLAPRIMADPLFTDGVNVGVVEMLCASSLRLSVYERPGVLTTACGSGACAAVQAARLTKRTDRTEMQVRMQAGAVTIRIRPDNVAEMTGPVAHCFHGNFNSQDENTSTRVFAFQFQPSPVAGK